MRGFVSVAVFLTAVFAQGAVFAEGDSMILTHFRYYMDINRPDICGSKVYFTSQDFYIGIAYRCCEAGLGNDGPIKGPYDENEPLNGYQCLSCFTENDVDNTTNCIPNTIMNCTGNQEECLSFNGTASRATKPEKYYSFQGCVTAGGCVTGIDSLAATKPMVYNMSCSPATKCVKSHP